MSLKRKALESMASLYVRKRGQVAESADTSKIFILRNNDLGDVLLVTPLLHVLREAFPESKIGIGVGHWAMPILENNPDVDEVHQVDAPWHNKAVCKVPWNSLLGMKNATEYVSGSDQVDAVYEKEYLVGIDVLGSPYGAMLLAEAGIPWRIGVEGYAGGETCCQQVIEYDPEVHVARFALGFAEALGASVPDAVRPRIHLSGDEKKVAQAAWEEAFESSGKYRILVAPGAGLPEKRWPAESFARLCQLIAESRPASIVILGSQDDNPLAETILEAVPDAVNLCGEVSLRESFALASGSHLVLSNSSLMMHVAAAFEVNNIVLLGPSYDSAEAHARQWGYPESCIVLGPEPDEPGITSAEDAFTTLEQSGAIG